MTIVSQQSSPHHTAQNVNTDPRTTDIPDESKNVQNYRVIKRTTPDGRNNDRLRQNRTVDSRQLSYNFFL